MFGKGVGTKRARASCICSGWSRWRRTGAQGYKGHVAVDPESEIITATEVTPCNVADSDAAESLLSDVLTEKQRATPSKDFGTGRALAPS
jgi:hypothetical protein